MIELALPEDWSVAPLVDCLDKESVISDGDWVESKDQDVGGSVRLIQLADIGDGFFRNKSNRFMNTEDASRLNCTYLKEGDVLIARMPDPLGRACIFPKLTQEAVTVVDICLIRPGNGSALNSNLLKFWINSPIIRNKIAMNATGTTRKRITRKKLEKFHFPVPPLAEQEQIRKLLNLHLTTVSQIQDRLDAIPKLIEKFRQSVLNDAVSGALCNNQNVNSSIVSELCDFQNGFAFKSGWFLKQGKFQVIKLGNIRENRLAIENSPAFLDENIGKDHSKFCANKNDILISMTGTRFKRDYGFSCLVTESEKFLINQRVGRFIVNEEKIIHKYLLLILRSNGFRNDFFEGETGGVNQGNVGSNHIKNISINYPDISTQEKIVNKTEVLFSFADQIEKSVATAKARVDHLTQSILHQAFTGNLTAEWREQNPDLISGENSAEALLAKIKAEKQGSGKKVKNV